jgi:hypothetical protein
VKLNHVRCRLSLICAAFLCRAVSVLAAPPSIPVTAIVVPDGRYSSVAIREMGREAAHILKQSGVVLHWHLREPTLVVNGRLVVVKLLGRCDMDGSPAFLTPGPLGWAHEVDGAVIPFTDLACDNIRGAVQSAVVGGNQLRGNILLGRAMGRVLAHELYHVVADTSQHGLDGVTQAALTSRELTTGSLELQASQVAAVQRGLSRRQ